MNSNYQYDAAGIPDGFNDFQRQTDTLLSGDTSEGVFISSVYTGKYTYVSRSYCALKGYEPHVFYEGGVDFFIKQVHPEDWKYLHGMTERLHAEIAQPDYDRTLPRVIPQAYRVKHAQGHWINLSVYLSILTYTALGRADKIIGLILQEEPDSQKRLTLIETEKRYSKVLALCSIFHECFEEPINDKHDVQTNGKSLLEMTLTTKPRVQVSGREKEVLELIAKGFSNKQIADQLFISPHTAINHRKNLIEKFEARNTAHLMQKASKYFSL